MSYQTIQNILSQITNPQILQISSNTQPTDFKEKLQTYIAGLPPCHIILSYNVYLMIITFACCANLTQF